jgi:cytochrome c oxidase cbb3-type subunit I/II
VTQLIPMYQMRALGGIIYLVGMILMAYNLYKTAKSGKLVADVEAQAPVPSQQSHEDDHHPWRHRWIESKPIMMTLFAIIAISIGGLVEIVPMYLIKSNVPTISSVKPYTPLEVLGRDIYIREGCVGCHSQMIRPFRSETERYGEYSKAGEFVYDHPFLWGSKRTGPDLHRIGQKYPDAWHYTHTLDPETTSPGSIMPKYPWLYTQEMEVDSLPARIGALSKVGVPYPAGAEDTAKQELESQALQIVENLKDGMVSDPQADKEIIALIAYLQRLGTDIKAAPEAEVAE